MASIRPTWRLQGSTRKVIACHVQPTAATVHAVTVAMGVETLLEETYPDQASAMIRARQVRDRLLEHGTWADVNDDPQPNCK